MTNENVFGTWKKAEITWFSNAAKIGKTAVSLGYCSFGRGVALATPYNCSLLYTLLIHDVYYNDLECEDEKWCFNLKCPLNKAETKYFAKYGLKSFSEVKNAHSIFEEIANRLNFSPKGSVVIHYSKPVLEVKVKKHGGGFGNFKG